MPDHDVLVVGGGFSGIGAAIALEKAGFRDYRIVDDNDGFGGTWRWNTYPGIAVDIPSFSYQYSFEKRTDWSRTYAPGNELRAYADDVAQRHGLAAKTRFGVRVDSATFDEDERMWALTTRDGEALSARHVIDATGVLTNPKMPEIDGVDTFAGTTLHTARWDHSVDLRGKRVAVIGTGASAVQVIPAIAEEVEHLTVFQRTPIWCMPKFDHPIPPVVGRTLRRVPGTEALARLMSQALIEVTFTFAAHYHRGFPMTSVVEKMARKYLEEQVPDPVLRDKLTPRYALGCKRPSFHNEYLATFNRDDVVLETTPIERITADAVVTEDGTEHEVDVLILATGFKVFDPGNLPKFPVTGRDGADLFAYWDENRHQAYEGISVPGFPNYFWMFGPYAYNGSSYFNLVETQSRHIVRCLKHARERGAVLVEVTREANDRYFAEMLRRRTRQVFWSESCGNANSYYFDKHGDVPLRPVTTIETIWRANRFDLSDYRFTAADRKPALV
jgi:cation diffusion facilitator CzcD-associated flavoprotein CzcO